MLDSFIIDALERLRREQREEDRVQIQLPIPEPREEPVKPVIREEPIVIDMS